MSGRAQPEAFPLSANPPAIILVEKRVLIRECLESCLEEKLRLPVLAYGDIRDIRRDPPERSVGAIILSGAEGDYGLDEAASLRELSDTQMDVPILRLSDDDSRGHIANAFRSGAKGFIASGAPLDEVARAIRLVLMGGLFMPKGVSLEALESIAPPRRSGPAVVFTGREQEVVQALIKGKSNKLIASELKISENSVKVHIRNVMRKLDVSNRTAAVLKIGKAVAVA